MLNVAKHQWHFWNHTSIKYLLHIKLLETGTTTEIRDQHLFYDPQWKGNEDG